MHKHYDITEGDMYMVKTYESDKSKIEMSFDLTSYQPDAAAAVKSRSGSGSDETSNHDDHGRHHQDKPERVYQTIFLDAAGEKQREVDQGVPTNWTRAQIDPTKILLTKWWRQFGHSVRHFTKATPFWRFVQNKRRTLYAGSYTLVNTHEIAVIR
jgi:hypothetical protein